MYRAYYHAGYRQTAKISAFYADNGKYEPRDRHEKREHKADYGAHIGTGRHRRLIVRIVILRRSRRRSVCISDARLVCAAMGAEVCVVAYSCSAFFGIHDFLPIAEDKYLKRYRCYIIVRREPFVKPCRDSTPR